MVRIAKRFLPFLDICMSISNSRSFTAYSGFKVYRGNFESVDLHHFQNFFWSLSQRKPLYTDAVIHRVPKKTTIKAN